MHWVVDDGDTPSPDCDDNALAGDVHKGDKFPTGHLTPPISPTCRCIVLPAAPDLRTNSPTPPHPRGVVVS